MELEKKSIDGFTAMIASSSPFPGGGGASAAVAAIGAALGDMVCEFTVGKKLYADVEDEMQSLMAHAKELREKFLLLINRDAEAFLPLSKAYKLSKDDPLRDAEMERCLRIAAAAPLEIFELACEAIELFGPLAEKGSRLAVSDAATGAVFCRAAIYGAAVNVKANTRLMKDREYADRLDRQLDAGIAKYAPIADAAFDSVFK